MNEYVNAAMDMLSKFITAATPAVQKAYEVSLLVLQLDALGQIIGFMVGGILATYLVWMTGKRLAAATAAARGLYGEDGPAVGWGCGFLAALAGLSVCIINLLNIWLWVKLFRPELWLVHMAIDKLVK